MTLKTVLSLERVAMPEFEFELYDAAWDSLNEREKRWIGRPDFDSVCEAYSAGTTARNLYQVLGIDRRQFNEHGQYPKRRLALTNWFKDVFKRRPIAAYVNALRDNEVPPWNEVIRELRVNSQKVIRNKLDQAADSPDPDREALALAKWVAEYEMGKPEQRSRHTADVSDNAIAAFDRASDRVAEALSGLAVPSSQPVAVVDTKDHPVGDSEPEA
jgi:hypothetical protein